MLPPAFHVLHFAPFLRLNSLRLAGVRDGPVGRGTALQAGRSWVRFPIVLLEFFIDIVLPAALWP